VRIGVTEWVLREQTTLRAIERAASAGYPAIELSASPTARAPEVRDALDRYGLEVPSLCPVYSLERDCAHADARLRRAARDAIRASLELAEELGARVLIVIPTYRVDEETDRHAELERAAETISSALEGTPAGGPLIALEALNRYETHLVRTLAEADELRRLVDSPHVQLMADVFHMNIEEDDIVGTLRQFADSIVHVHLADNQRRSPGTGTLDFDAITSVLRQNGYDGAAVMEFEPADDDALKRGLATVSSL
jgi:D-psicose/D-tagatose/L-ribulose 3-epimerase